MGPQCRPRCLCPRWGHCFGLRSQSHPIRWGHCCCCHPPCRPWHAGSPGACAPVPWRLWHPWPLAPVCACRRRLSWRLRPWLFQLFPFQPFLSPLFLFQPFRVFLFPGALSFRARLFHAFAAPAFRPSLFQPFRVCPARSFLSAPARPSLFRAWPSPAWLFRLFPFRPFPWPAGLPAHAAFSAPPLFSCAPAAPALHRAAIAVPAGWAGEGGVEAAAWAPVRVQAGALAQEPGWARASGLVAAVLRVARPARSFRPTVRLRRQLVPRHLEASLSIQRRPPVRRAPSMPSPSSAVAGTVGVGQRGRDQGEKTWTVKTLQTKRIKKKRVIWRQI